MTQEYEERIYGMLLTNRDGDPEVRITKVCTVNHYQSFQIETDRDVFQFGVTPKGYLRVFAVRHKPKPKKS